MSSVSMRFRRAAMSGLLTVFVLYTVGIPIVVASCPMAKAPGRTTCAACLPTSDDRVALSVERNSACCATVMVSGRSLTEYVGAAKPSGLHPPPAGFFIAAGIDPAASRYLSSPTVAPNATAGRSPGDLPVRFSSLLI